MARVKLIVDKEDVAPEHYALFDALAALRGRISGPSTVVLHSPGLARPWNEISEYLHRESLVEAEHAELAVLVGHYGIVTGILNAFEVAPAPDAEPLPLGSHAA
jgi:hypothetical protein